jgi:predicted  nucleic acid-binding Zn-ribbon protein
MGYGSAGTPPWVDEERIDQEKKDRQNAENERKLKALEKENATLKKRIKHLESELQNLKKT